MKFSIRLTPDQIDVVQCNARFIGLFAGRRWGKTFTSRARILAKTSNPGTHYWYIAPSYSQVIQEFDALVAQRELSVIITRHKTQPYPSIDLANGSCIGFRTFDRPNNLRGASLDEVWFDEIQGVTEDDFWPVIRPLISDRRGSLIVSGQFRGHDWVYDQFYVKGQEGGHPAYKSFRFPSSTGLVFASEEGKAELALARSTLPRAVYDQEYECIPTANQASVFRPQDLEDAKRGSYTKSGMDGRTYCVAVDIGRVADPCALVVLDVDSDTVCYSEVLPLGQKHELSARRVAEIAQRFGNATVIADTTGGATGGHAKPDEHVKFYRDAVPGMKSFYWSQANKAEAVSALSLAVEQGKIMIPAENADLHKQLSLYEYKVRSNGSVEYSGARGAHDDLVAALYLAWVAKRRNMVERRGAGRANLAAIGL